MMEWPHLLQGTEESGARSPGMNTFVLQLMQVTILRGLSVLILPLINTLSAQATSVQTSIYPPNPAQV